jgi:hypothetical protein
MARFKIQPADLYATEGHKATGEVVDYAELRDAVRNARLDVEGYWDFKDGIVTLYEGELTDEAKAMLDGTYIAGPFGEGN